MLSLLLGGLLFTAPMPWTPADNNGFLCAQQCWAGSCARLCSLQQRCQTHCLINGEAACYCHL